MGPDLFFPEFDQEMAQTRVALARIPADRFDFKPHEKSWTMGELATHIATVPLWLIMTLATDEFDLEAPLDPSVRESLRLHPAPRRGDPGDDPQSHDPPPGPAHGLPPPDRSPGAQPLRAVRRRAGLAPEPVPPRRPHTGGRTTCNAGLNI